MRAFMTVLALVATTVASTSCTGRRIDVVSEPAPQSEVSLHVNNTLAQPVNVYVISGGTTTFLRQVAARSTEHVPVPNVQAGSTVTLRATQADGARSYDRANVQLTGMYSWQIP